MYECCLAFVAAVFVVYEQEGSERSMLILKDTLTGLGHLLILMRDGCGWLLFRLPDIDCSDTLRHCMG